MSLHSPDNAEKTIIINEIAHAGDCHASDSFLLSVEFRDTMQNQLLFLFFCCDCFYRNIKLELFIFFVKNKLKCKKTISLFSTKKIFFVENKLIVYL